MKAQRQAKIVEIISNRNVETQEQLLDELRRRGFSSTQATISRDIKQLHLFRVMERRPLDYSTAKLHWLEIGYRSHGTCPADLIIYAEQPCQRLFSLELVSYCPARELRGKAQVFLICKLIYLDDYTVCREWQILSSRIPVFDILFNFGSASERPSCV